MIDDKGELKMKDQAYNGLEPDRWLWQDYYFFISFIAWFFLPIMALA